MTEQRQPLAVTLLQLAVGLFSALVMFDIQTGGSLRRWATAKFSRPEPDAREPFYGVAGEVEEYLREEATP